MQADLGPHLKDFIDRLEVCSVSTITRIAHESMSVLFATPTMKLARYARLQDGPVDDLLRNEERVRSRQENIGLLIFPANKERNMREADWKILHQPSQEDSTGR